MESWIDQPWTRRWWRMPGEMLLSQQFDKTQATVTFTWCNPTEWGLEFVIDGGAPVNAIFHVDSEDLTGTKAVPRPVVAALMEQFQARERGIRNAAKLANDPLLNAIAEQLPKQEWTTGRRLRKLTGLDVDAFQRHLGRLMPRYVRRDAFEADDKYSLTLPGLIVMDAKLRSTAVMESIYQAVARCYDRDEEAESFEISDIVACGVADADLPLARVIAQVCVLVGGNVAIDDLFLRMPPDAEMIAAQVKKKVSFHDYLIHSATEKQRNIHFAVNRPWLQAPLVIERDALRIDYLPMGFLSHPSSMSDAVVAAPPRAVEAPTAKQEAASAPEILLPRLDVKYGEKLGDGAFGTVWEATDVLLERKLAVKFLTSTDEHLDEKALLRQARSLALVAHPNLVVVYGAAWLRHPKTGLVEPAIMMELLDGEPLLSWSAVQHDREAALHVAWGLLNGIAAMHAAGLHHGDLHARNVLVLRDGQAKVIDWRYQDTFLARSTASREQLIEDDARHAIDRVVSLFERQGLRDESLELRRMSTIPEAQKYLERLTAAPAVPAVAPAPVTEPLAPVFPPAPARLDRSNVNETEKTESQSELAIWPVQESDLDAGELMAEIDSLFRDGVVTGPVEWLFRNPPVKTIGTRRWELAHREAANVIQKWELDIRDRGFLAFRWAKFAGYEQVFYETRELLDSVVVPIHLYGLAMAAAAKRMGTMAVARAHFRLTAVGSSDFTLLDDAKVTTKAIYSPKAEAKLATDLEAAIPGPPGAIAARLINRILSNFHVERHRLGDQGSNAPLVRLDEAAYDKYLALARVTLAAG
jgi:serine/threonine-protein kinase RIO1